jgi:hypothetical protein
LIPFSDPSEICAGSAEPPGEPLPDLGERFMRHSRGNAKGLKAVRPGMRSLAASRFETLPDMAALADRLFGACSQEAQ